MNAAVKIIAQFDIAANIDAGKLLPRKFGMQIPIYTGISHNSATPEYDPYDLDIKLKDKMKSEFERSR